MEVNRRVLLQMLGASAGASLLPSDARAQFPPQSAIDSDPLRPRYHLMPRRGWMNDPCAPVFYKGKYHMFFQHNPGASVWGDMHWGHAVSTDMVHWQHRPEAMAPTPGGPDSAGVFTGTMVLDKGRPAAIFTAVRRVPHAEATIQDTANDLQESQCLATPVDNSLDRWTKLPQPVVPRPPAGMQVTGFRDPTPWREKDGWYMLVASGQRGVGGNVLLYKSADLRTWQFLRIFAEGKPVPSTGRDPVDTGEMWECPDFFPLEDRHVLIHSTGSAEGRVTLWQTGRLDRAKMVFAPEKEGVLNHGPYYAPKTQLDADGNRILWGWIPETRPEAEFAKAGWAGCMSLPRVLTLKDGELRFAPAKQVESLREPQPVGIFAGLIKASPQQETIVRVQRGTERSVSEAAGPGMDDGWMLIRSDAALGSNVLTLDGTRYSFDKPLPPEFSIRAFQDGSVTEIFVGSRITMSSRRYGRVPSTCTLNLPSGYTVRAKNYFRLKSI